MISASEPAEASQAVASQLAPTTRFDRALALVPRALSSHAHIIFLGALGVYLVLLPLVGVSVSAKTELIGGNYTNVTSDLGACIAAGLTVHLVAPRGPGAGDRARDRRRGARRSRGGQDRRRGLSAGAGARCHIRRPSVV